MKQVVNTYMANYDEETAIKELACDIELAAQRQLDLIDAATDAASDTAYDQIQILVNGKVHAFFLGGPQMKGLYEFMNNICSENGYEKP